MTTNTDQQVAQSETLVREWANFHPDIPLTRKYADLVRRIDDLFRQSQGCTCCNCVCDKCAPCGERE